MTVYIDDMCDRAMGCLGRMKMSHMIADTRAELLAMADRLGLNRAWLQKPGEPGEHFDVSKAKRAQAIRAGAVPVEMRQLACMTQRRGVEGVLGDPADALPWRARWRLQEAQEAQP